MGIEKKAVTDAAEKRDGFIDALKGFGIIMMVIGHSGAPKALIQLIYGFHMPLFFIVSGYLFNFEKWNEKGIPALISRKADSLIKPYFKYSLINLILCLPVLLTGDAPLRGLELLKKTALMIGWTVYGYTTAGKTEWGPMWFLLCLFIAVILFALFLKVSEKTEKRIMICIALFVVERFLVQFKKLPLPWHFDVAIIGMIFMYAGYMIRKTDLLDSGKIDKAGLVVLAVFAIWVISGNGYCLDLNNNRMGTSSIAGFAGALSAVLVFMFIFRRLSGTFELKPLRFIGKNSVIVIAFNACLNSYTTRIWNVIPFLNKFEYKWWIKSIVVLALVSGLAVFKNRAVLKIKKQ